VTIAVLVAGLFWWTVSIAGAALTLAICGFYLARLSAPGRRDSAGLAGFTLFAALACGLLVLRLAS